VYNRKKEDSRGHELVKVRFRVNDFLSYERSYERLLQRNHASSLNALRVAADRSAGEIGKKFRSRYIARLTGSG